MRVFVIFQSQFEPQFFLYFAIEIKSIEMKTALGRLRTIGFLEGCSYLLFAVTMPIKYLLEIPQPNYFVGMAHGLLFVAYIALVFQNAYLRKWDFMKTAWALLASIVPFGTFIADAKIFKLEQEV